MQNQAAVEALYSATFVEDYLDCVENLPNNLQIFITKLREFDLIQYNEFLKDFGSLVTAFEQETTASGQRAILSKIQHGLILAQDIGDGKLSTVQAMTDLLETRTRQLEHDSQNAEFVKVEADEYDRSSPAVVSSSSGNNVKQLSSSKTAKNRTHEDKTDKGSVKKRKKMVEKSGRDSAKDSGANSSPTDEDESIPPKSNSSLASASKSRTSVGSSKKSSSSLANASSPAVVKRKQAKRSAAQGASNVERDDSDHGIDPSNVEIDPDEPTYCLCDQISYGEMIGCDNDLCPIEWFHFSCVQLTTKPKGKWFCPKCRGDKPTLMKPKALFLKELDKYNKEKGEKAMKQAG